MTTAQILNIVFAILSIVATFVGYYFYIRGKAYKAAQDAVDQAEQVDKTGEQKLADAVDQVYALIPAVLKPFLSRNVVQNIVQVAFDKIEDYAKKQVAKKGKKED